MLNVALKQNGTVSRSTKKSGRTRALRDPSFGDDDDNEKKRNIDKRTRTR